MFIRCPNGVFTRRLDIRVFSLEERIGLEGAMGITVGIVGMDVMSRKV